MFGNDQTYCFVPILTDTACALIWGNMQTLARVSKDAMVVMIGGRKLQMDSMPYYVPYKRTDGAMLVGEG